MKNSDFTLDERCLIKRALQDLEIELIMSYKDLPDESPAQKTRIKKLGQVSDLIEKVKLFI